MKVVAVGNSRDVDLKRIGDAAFSCQEIILGKVKNNMYNIICVPFKLVHSNTAACF